MRSGVRVALCTLLLPVFGSSYIYADHKSDAQKELQKLQGAWTFASQVVNGKAIPAENLKNLTLNMEGDKFTVKQGEEMYQTGRQKLDPSKTPKTLNAEVTEGPEKGSVMLGIYELDGDTLKVCFDLEGKKRPTGFKSTAGSNTILIVHKRVKK
jgi:uncharacterized protein (TIGR03067 family)